jgi:hypothetical protein
MGEPEKPKELARLSQIAADLVNHLESNLASIAVMA